MRHMTTWFCPRPRCSELIVDSGFLPTRTSPCTCNAIHHKPAYVRDIQDLESHSLPYTHGETRARDKCERVCEIRIARCNH